MMKLSMPTASGVCVGNRPVVPECIIDDGFSFPEHAYRREINHAVTFRLSFNRCLPTKTALRNNKEKSIVNLEAETMIDRNKKDVQQGVGADLAGGNRGWFASLYQAFFLRPNSSTLNVMPDK